jgi:hypothetical protein
LLWFGLLEYRELENPDSLDGHGNRVKEYVTNR